MKKIFLALFLLLASLQQVAFSVNQPFQGAANILGFNENGTCTIQNNTQYKLKVLLGIGKTDKGTVMPGKPLEISFSNLKNSPIIQELTIETVDSPTKKSFTIQVYIKNNSYYTITPGMLFVQ